MRKGPEFVRFIKPIVEILKSNGGSGKAGETVDRVIDQMDITDDELAATNKNGGSRIKNQVHWARQYLVSYGAIDNSTRGVWALTSSGQKLEIPDAAAALEIFDTVQRERKSVEEELDEVDASEDENNYWFVGAVWGAKGDQLERFLNDGIWMCGYEDKHRQEILSMKVGDPIAIKAAYTRKNNVPFDNKGKTVSVMAIKATGVISETSKDGRTVKVDWNPRADKREWYFFTMRNTVWRVTPGEWYSDALIAFTFDNQPQKYSQFISGFEHLKHLKPDADVDFSWTDFYMEFADKLLAYKNDRTRLMKGIIEIAHRNDNLQYLLHDQFSDGSIAPLKDICPFTLIGSFNRGLTIENRISIAREYAAFFDIQAPVPVSFPGIPTLNNQSSWLFSYEKNRGAGDIDALWEVFDAGLKYADDPGDETMQMFIKKYDQSLKIKGVRRNLAQGLYWVRPFSFAPLDQNSCKFILEKLNFDLPALSGYAAVQATDYIDAIEQILSRFDEDDFPVNSFPQMSHEAYFAKYDMSTGIADTNDSALDDVETVTVEDLAGVLKQMYNSADSKTTAIHLFGIKYAAQIQACDGTPKDICVAAGLSESYQAEVSKGMRLAEYVELVGTESEKQKVSDHLEEGTPYNIDNIVTDGCFVPKSQLEDCLVRLGSKKNIILQGPPGTGKTWLAKRLGYALVGQKRPRQITSVQFHPNLSYEDFICGYRPSSDGKLLLTEGPFMQLVTRAIKHPQETFVLVIEEINRGNPSQIFGEMLTLLEADKRTPDDAMKLSYAGEDERTYIPDNFYVIGTMNIADRSLALVDLALRRRFAFIGLAPRFENSWKDWTASKGVPMEIVNEIASRMNALNAQIAEDNALGDHFLVGHSYVTPGARQTVDNPLEWYKQVVHTEIAPLLEEYWFDNQDLAKEAVKKLTEGL